MYCTLHAWLELTYFASGPALFIVALLALRQVRIAREALEAARDQVATANRAIDLTCKEIDLRSRREAIVLASQQCQAFGGAFIPVLEKRMNVIAKVAMPTNWNLRDTDFQWSSFADPAGAKAWNARVSADLVTRRTGLDLLNDLEGVAMHFAQGAADEAVAFSVIGTVFCDAIEKLAPVLVGLREDVVPGIASGPYENTVMLFRTWYVRKRGADLQQESARVAREASKGGAPRPIGTSPNA